MQEKKRVRAFTPKVKTGCVTCKNRRIKCDEGKPRCEKCIISDRQCHYLPTTTRPSYPNVGSSNSSSSTTVLLPPNKWLSLDIPGTPQERRGWAYFTQCTAPELSGYFSPHLWESLILQAGISQPVLRHAIIAIGSVHKRFNAESGASGSRFVDSDEIQKLESYATTQYVKAISLLREAMQKRNLPIDVVLLSCALFTCLDCFRGQAASAVVHLQGGLNLLRELEAGRLSVTQSQEYIVKNGVAQLFQRLGVQIGTYAEAGKLLKAIPQCGDVSAFMRSQPPPKERGEICSVDQARDVLFMLIHDNAFLYFWQPDEIPDDILPWMRAQKALHLEALYKWIAAFDRYLSGAHRSLTSFAVRGSVMTKILGKAVEIALTSCVVKDFDFRPMLPQFETIVLLARSLVVAEGASKDGRRAAFLPEMGILASLYQVIGQCPDVEVKRQAYDLILMAPRREGLWDTRVLRKAIGGSLSNKNSPERQVDGDLEDNKYHTPNDCSVENDGIAEGTFAFREGLGAEHLLELVENRTQAGTTSPRDDDDDDDDDIDMEIATLTQLAQILASREEP